MLRKRVGYDMMVLFSREELEAMYLKEGNMTSEQAKAKASEIYKELRNLRVEEERLWRKVRENEIPSGLEPTIPEEKKYES